MGGYYFGHLAKMIPPVEIPVILPPLTKFVKTSILSADNDEPADLNDNVWEGG